MCYHLRNTNSSWSFNILDKFSLYKNVKRHTGLGFLEFTKEDAQKHERHACQQEYSR
jgi:hypothetical protein